MLHGILVAAVWMGALVLFVLLPLNFAMTPRLSGARPRPTRLPRVSIVVPARNEERDVERAVRSLLAQDYPGFEVIVVEDRSIDRTPEILAALSGEIPRLTVLAGSEPPPGWLGKPHALFLGAKAAGGEVLLFVDADVRYDPRTLGEAVALLEGRRLDLLALLPRMEAVGFWENVLMPYVLGAYFGAFGFLANVDRPRWMAAGGGAGNLVRRSVYDALGGHAALKDSVIDDVNLALKAKRAGFVTRAALAVDRISVRMYSGLAEVVGGFTKNMAYAFNGILGAVLLVLTTATTLLWLAPPLVLLGWAAGMPVEPRDALAAVAACALVIASRVAAAAALGDPLWAAWTHPIMAATWAVIIGRSLYQRVVRKRLVWRGREFDARSARF